MKIRDISRDAAVGNYLSFLSGIQIAAGVQLLITLYSGTVTLQRDLGMVAGGLMLGVGGYLSASLAWAIREILNARDRRIGTVFDPEEEMKRVEDEEVIILSRFKIKRLDRIVTFVYSDIILSGIALGLLVAIRVIPSLI